MVENRPHQVTSGGQRLAVEVTDGAAPDLLWLSGFRSDMTGGKSLALADWGARHGHKVVRFDYRGHGASQGRFEDFVISDWLADTRLVHDAYCSEGAVVVGSSMGGWLALLLARDLLRAGRPLGGLVLIAPATDFTERLMLPSLPQDARERLEREGLIHLPSDYDTPTPITKRLIEDGRNNLLFGDAPVETGCPVHILQGVQDDAVPHAHALELVERLAQDDVVMTLVKDGDHRLSREEDVERILAAVDAIVSIAAERS